ncbi:MAG: FG-GAP-like repeat-containing protein, partial [Nitrospira sp.]|nr:FG-GAP-like repeat-containing protein [Nitrospira sp.]
MKRENNINNLPRLLLVILIVLLVTGMRSQETSLTTPPLKPQLVPTLQTIDPIPNTHTAPVTTTVSIIYDEAISETTVSPQTFAAHAMQTGLLLQTYSVNGGTITLTPTQPFKPGELIQVTATTGIENQNDEGSIKPIVWQFRTAVGGNGTGVFVNTGQNLVTSDTHIAYESLGDLDGDGDLDAFIAWGAAGSNFADKVWYNDGSGYFTDSGQNLGSSKSQSVALGDLDGDGDLDAYVGNGIFSQSQPNEVWLNDGHGNFSDSGQKLGNYSTYEVKLADLDGDGDLDAFEANYVWQSNKVWLNDGHGNFSDSGQNLGSGTLNWDVDLGDLDGDGDIDAFVAVDDNGPNQVWLNNGSGVFSNSGQSLGNSKSMGVALGDVDNDGDLDAAIANTIGSP